MKRFLLFSLLCFSSIGSFAQWDSLNGGVKGAAKYAPPLVYTLLSSPKILYVGGLFDTVDGMPASGIALWNGTNWSIIGKIQYGTYAMAMVEYNGNLIVGGNFDSIGGHASTNVVQWNGTTWSSLGTASGVGSVEDMAVYNGNLYVGGIAGGKLISKWNGTAWTNPLKTIKSTCSSCIDAPWIYAMVVWNNKLYVGGHFDSINGKYIRNLAVWNDTTWEAVNNNMLDTTVCALCVYNNKLYAGGFISKSSYTNSIGIINEWDGTTWSSLGGSTTNYGYIYTIAANGSNLYVGGRFDSIGGVSANNIAYWDGSNWNSAGAGVSGDVYGLASFRTGLYAGGSFSYAGAIRANNIASYQDPNSINELSQSNLVTVYPNPGNGVFNFKMANGQQLMAGSKIELYNMLGENIASAKSLPLGGSGWALDLNDQPSGVYLYRLTDKNGIMLSTGKLLIER